MRWWIGVLAAAAAGIRAAEITLSYLPLPLAPPLPSGMPRPAPLYMQDNQGNPHGHAPDKGLLTGPVLEPLTESVIKALHGNGLVPSPPLEVLQNITSLPLSLEKRDTFLEKRSDYWLADITHGQMPYAGSNYTFYRNVKDFGATGDGVTDDTAAINQAVASGNRCGANCGSTTTKGALVYFPPGTYLISTPIIQYYYTQFVGDVNQKPTIKGSGNFSGIGLIDTDFYIPGGGGAEWYINQNQFYRQIRNFVFDLTAMPLTTNSSGQLLMPTGIHYQVAQATSLQNLDFVMPQGGNTTHVGIFMENGSGGFASDLTFFGGAIGWRAGTQQFTARNIQFTSCLKAVEMIWDWGFTWQNVQMTSVYVAFDCTSYGGAALSGGSTFQGTGSIAVIDSSFNGVPYAITLNNQGATPNIVLDNLLVQNSASVVLISGGATILEGSSSGALLVQSWASGLRYTSTTSPGVVVSGDLNPVPSKSPNLLDSNGNWFAQSKPQYDSTPASAFVVATANGISNGATGDQSAAINTLLANNVGTPIFFPAGIYLVESTINVPVGSIIVGEGWSQFMATGSYFQNEADPQVLFKVGNPGDEGVIQISDVLFTVMGPTAGAILVEWNVHESSQGSAAMWDSHFRVGGAYGSDLSLANCPTSTKGAAIANCKAASMLMHVTPSASGYFENIWAWVADHDLDSPLNGGDGDNGAGVPQASNVQISIFAGRGILIESQGPTWFYGTSSEHSVLYQYMTLNAQNVYLGHMQTETPYFQPGIPATQPYRIGAFPSDPQFENCAAGTNCNDAWAFRVLNSSNIFVYSAGLYSFFESYVTGTCTAAENCQQSIFETSFTQGLWMYNLFTKGSVEVVSPDGRIPTVFQNDTHQTEFTSEVSAWLVLALSGGDQGSIGNQNTTGSGVVYIGPQVWTGPHTAGCYPPCTLVLPPYQLSTTTTITFPLYTTTLDVAWSTTTVVTSGGSTKTVSTVSHVLETTTITIPPLTTTAIPVWNVQVNSTSSKSSSSSGAAILTYYPTSSIGPQVITITDDPDPQSLSHVTHSPVTRTLTIPPFPFTTPSTHESPFPPITITDGPPGPECTAGCGSLCLLFCHGPCLIGCGGGGFPDPIDPNPLPDPNPEPSNERQTTTTCSTATVTDYFVSCVSVNPTSTSCTTTSSRVESGCDVTATTSTTGVPSCAVLYATVDQPQNGASTAPPPTAATNGWVSYPTPAVTTHSSSTTTTTSSSTGYTASATVGPLHCFPATYSCTSDFPDVEPNDVGTERNNLCSSDPTWNPTYTLKPGSAAGDDDSYGQVLYSVGAVWIEGCTFAGGSTQELHYPLGTGNRNVNCTELVQGTYNNCNNNGHGGYIDVGCVRYYFLPQQETNDDPLTYCPSSFPLQ